MSALAGTGELLKLALRRSRIMIAVWLYALLAYVASNAYGFKSLYDSPQSLRDFVSGINKNGATVALYGRINVPDSVAGVTAWRLAGIGATLIGVMSVLIVVRHTRGDEEAGRLELVGAGVVGRRAPLTAGLLAGVVASGALALVSAVLLIAFGMPAVGSFAFGLAWLVPGLCFTAVAGLAAQLAESTLAARGIALAVLGVAFLLRAAGDAARVPWLSWLSPIGWSQQVRAYGADRWWIAGLAVAFTAVLVGAAYALVERRDLGAGLLPARPGPAAAAPSLRSPLALAWRLQRGTLFAWLAAFAVYGAVVGGVIKGLSGLVGDSSGTRDLLAKMGGQRGLEDSYIGTIMGVLGLIAAVYAVQTVLRMRTEETAQRLEPLLATGVRRVRWTAGHLVFTVFGTAVLLAAAGLMAGLIHGLRVHDVGTQVPRLLGAALVQLPAAWVAAAIGLLLFGAVPRFATAVWGVLGVFLLLGQLGPVLRLSQAVLDLSPFTHVPKLPASGLSVAPIAALTAVAVAVAAAGLAALRRRDIG